MTVSFAFAAVKYMSDAHILLLAFRRPGPPWPARRQPVETKRRIPRQARAAETVAAIVEAAAQILEAGGLAGFTTNAVAERAGVSIGTLYQYFADKNAVLLALAARGDGDGAGEVARALQGESRSLGRGPRPRHGAGDHPRLSRPAARAQGRDPGDPVAGKAASR